MNLLPIITRELRAEARQPVNYGLRMLGAAVLTVVLGVLLANQEGKQSGGNAFLAMSVVVFCGIWIVVPILTADCLSREKREGTLGLLFLTPLKPFEIILGKGTIHAIRALTLIVAVVPVVTVPFVLGGITRSNVVASLVLDSAALLFALAAGLLASSLCRQWTRAIILAELFSFLFFYAFLWLAIGSLGWTGTRGNSVGILLQILESAYYAGRYPGFGTPLAPAMINLVSPLIAIMAAAMVAFILALVFASYRLRKTWQENPPSSRQRWLQQTFCTPRFWVGLLRRQNATRLSRNPIGWLQQYSWSARLGKWGWCFAVITIVSWFLATDTRIVNGGLLVLKTAILISMAFSAVGSFQREKQNGALELLLVTPLQERQIILGRLWGIWGQFLPGYSILLVTALSIAAYFPSSGSLMNGSNLIGWICDFTVVPVVGLYFAMRVKRFVTAWLFTCAMTLFLPQFVSGILLRTVMGFYGSPEELKMAVRFSETLIVSALAISLWSRLHRLLKSRRFALEHH